MLIWLDVLIYKGVCVDVDRYVCLNIVHLCVCVI